MNNKILLVIGCILLLIGLFRPSIFVPVNNGPVIIDNNSIVVVSPPSDKELKDKCKLVIDILVNSKTNSKKDGQRLCDLYIDLATLIELDAENETIKTTEEIRQANTLAGPMLRMNMQGKYPGLADAAQIVIASQIGDDAVALDSELRKKAVDAFKALAWACYEGTK